MNLKIKYHPVVEKLVKLITENHWEEKFEIAIGNAKKKNVSIIDHVTNLDQYLDWINKFLYWVPSENTAGQNIDDHLSAFYFIADQEPVLSLQNKLIPQDKSESLTPFSQWLVEYSEEMGAFLDSPESLTLESEQTFYNSPSYNMREYSRPHGGWKSFNQIFARHFKPGFRPIAAIADQSIVTAPADATFVGQWEIRKDSNVTVKGINWKICELMDESPYKDCFENGLFIHAYLSPTDYHRIHAPVGGRVLEARIIPGQVYLEVEAAPVSINSSKHHLKLKRNFDSPDNLGYQFSQTRGLIVLDSPIGRVAVIPVGMCQVSSVIITAEEDVVLRKGEELAYFQFGGSDVILLFESATNMSISAQPNVHYKVGNKIGQAYPVI